MKFSMLEKPAPTWNVPVGRSLTSMYTAILSGPEPSSCEIRRARRAEGVMRLRDSSSVFREQLAFADLELAADHLSRVLLLPRTSMRSKYTSVRGRPYLDVASRRSGSSRVCGLASTLA